MCFEGFLGCESFEADIADGTHDALHVPVLEYIPSDGDSVSSCCEGIGNHVQDVHVRIHLGTACDDYGYLCAVAYPGERVDISGVGTFHNVGTELRTHPRGVSDGSGIEGILDGRTAGVGHGDQGHSPVHAFGGNHSRILKHLRLVLSSDVDVNGDRIGSELETIFYGCDEDLALGIHTNIG